MFRIGFCSLALASFVAFATCAQATVVTSNDELRVDFDFIGVGSIPGTLITSLNYRLNLEGDVLDTGEGYTISLYDSTGTQRASNTTTVISGSSNRIIGFFNDSTGLDVLDPAQGYLLVNNIIGSFSIGSSYFLTGYAPDGQGGIFSPQLTVTPLPLASVPEPTVLALFGLGVAGIGLARVSRKAISGQQVAA